MSPGSFLLQSQSPVLDHPGTKLERLLGLPTAPPGRRFAVEKKLPAVLLLLVRERIVPRPRPRGLQASASANAMVVFMVVALLRQRHPPFFHPDRKSDNVVDSMPAVTPATN